MTKEITSIYNKKSWNGNVLKNKYQTTYMLMQEHSTVCTNESCQEEMLGRMYDYGNLN